MQIYQQNTNHSLHSTTLKWSGVMGITQKVFMVISHQSLRFNVPCMQEALGTFYVCLYYM